MDKNKQHGDKFYNTYSINRIVKPPFSPISISKYQFDKNNLPNQGTGFHLKAHSRKENRLDEYNFFQESPGQQLKVLVDFNRKPSLKKATRNGSSKHIQQKPDSMAKVTRKSSKNGNSPFEGVRIGNPAIRKGVSEGKDLRRAQEGVLISKLFKAN